MSSAEWIDTDGDGIGDNADTDDDSAQKEHSVRKLKQKNKREQIVNGFLGTFSKTQGNLVGRIKERSDGSANALWWVRFA